jgi:RHS repeat-associated protein
LLKISIFDFNTRILSLSNHCHTFLLPPFGVVLKGRNWSTEEYRYGFNGKEKDDEGMGGGGSTYDYGFRIYNASLGKFLSMDPLNKKFSMLSSFQFASNMPIQAIDLDGLEAFIIHGTRQAVAGEEFTTDVIAEFMRLTGNSKYDRSFRWNSPTLNGPEMRKVAAKELMLHIIQVRTQMIANNQITEDEPVSLIGYSHGGNVAIQAAQMLYDSYGIKVNLITIGTPAKNSQFDVDCDNPAFGNQEDPQGNDGINHHYHIRHVNDLVYSISDVIEDSDAYYTNEGITQNFTIPNTIIELEPPVDAHTKIQSHEYFDEALSFLSPMPSAPKPYFINLIVKEILKHKKEALGQSDSDRKNLEDGK